MLRICLPQDAPAGMPLYSQLYEALKADIISGQLTAGTKLPSLREMAKSLSISSNTVERAYWQLEMEGYIRPRKKSGFFVLPLQKSISASPPKLAPPKMKEHSIKYDFGNDYIDQGSFDFILWRRYLNQSLQKDAHRFYDYGDPLGAYELREQLARYLHQSRRVTCTPDQIVIGASTQVLLNLLCGLVKDRYPRIGFEEPGFRHGRYVFQDHGLEIVPLALNEHGLSLKAFIESDVNFVYVSPSNQFPTGAVMPIGLRQLLISWMALHQGGLIIEDDYDSELRYFGHPIPSLQCLDTTDSVIYLGSFSKILLPALRISYMVLPHKLLPILTEKIGFYNQTASLIEQLTLARFMADGQLDRHIRKVRKIYAQKNQLLLDQLQEKMGNKIKILGKETGLHVLLEVQTSKTSDTLIQEAKEVGIAMTSLHSYALKAPREPQKPQVIMGYGGIPLAEIPPAVALLKTSWFGEA